MCVYSHFTLFEKHLQMYKINYKKSQEIKKKAKKKEQMKYTQEHGSH